MICIPLPLLYRFQVLGWTYVMLSLGGGTVSYFMIKHFLIHIQKKNKMTSEIHKIHELRDRIKNLLGKIYVLYALINKYLLNQSLLNK